MVKKIFLLFSHKFDEKQIADAKTKYKVDDFIYLPKELQKMWSNIPPDLEEVQEYLLEIQKFIKNSAYAGDVILIQGDFGAVFMMVNYCKELGLLCIYATTKRIITEYRNKEGELVKKSIFKHGRFREYGI